MQLFNRRVTVTGPPAATLAHLADMQAFVTAATGREVGLWSVGFGMPLGTYIYSMRVEGLADFQSVSAPLLDDPEYHAKLAAGADYITAPVEDSLADVVHGEVGDPPPVGAFGSVTTALIANGAYESAVGWAIDMTEHVNAVTDVATVLTMDATGDFGRLNWVGVASDAATMDAGFATLNADTDYLRRLVASADLFVEGSGRRIVGSRAA